MTPSQPQHSAHTAKRKSQIDEWGDSRYQDGLIAGKTQRDELIEVLKAAVAWGGHPFRIENVKIQPWFGRAEAAIAAAEGKE